MNLTIIADGPNLISRLIEEGIDKNVIAEKFSLYRLSENWIKDHLRSNSIPPKSFGLEFIHSQKLPGPKGNKLTKTQWEVFVKRSSSESGVFLNKVMIDSPNNEKGVDIAVAVRMIEVSEVCDIICLISSDKDYVPVLEYLRKKNKYICTVGFNDSHPIELKNLSYRFIDMTKFIQKDF
ncbi:MAG: NYN domain-containing protein [Bacteroidetes bacterium]|nr:NYN domain-containing protein [Bacteroidota bacterium]